MSEIKVGQRVLFMFKNSMMIPYLSYGKVIESEMVTVDFGKVGVWHCGKGEIEPMKYDLKDMGFSPDADDVCEAFGWGETPEGPTYWADFFFGTMTKEEAEVAQAKWDAMKKQWYEEQEAGDCLGREYSDFGADLAQSLKEAIEMDDVKSMKFKVGDRVKNIIGGKGYGRELEPNIGEPVDMGTIIDVRKCGCDVLWDGCEEAYFSFSEEIALVDSAEPLTDAAKTWVASPSEPLKEAWESYESLLVDTPEQHYTPKDIQPIVSDGGPSEYYDFKESHKTLNDWMEDKAKSQWGAYSLHMKDLGKGMCRFGTKNGVTEGYDINKMLYSTIRMKVMEVGKEKAVEYIRSVLEDPQFKV